MKPVTLYYLGFFLVVLAGALLMTGLASPYWASGTLSALKFQVHMGLFRVRLDQYFMVSMASPSVE